jgi:hypothetical protein
MFAKKLAGEDDVEAALQRLDRLTQEGAQMVNAQTMSVVHRLESNMAVAMKGGWHLFRRR